LSQAGRRLSGGLLQLLFNLPVISVLAYTGWLTAVNFFSNQILTGDFFLHAFWTIVVVLFLSFFLLQAVIRLAAGRQRLLRRVFSRLHHAMEHHSSLSDNPLWQQAKIIEGLKDYMNGFQP
jgi:Fe2+ transport system protein B